MVMSSAVIDSLRARPRRVIYALTLNHEIEHVLTTLSLLWDVVDVFVISEMNMTHYGDPRPWFIRELLEAGVFRPFEQKIFYIPCGLSDARLCQQNDSYVCNDHKYRCLEDNGIRSIPGLRGDDLIMYTDADEFIPAKIVHTLRYHESTYQHFSVFLKRFLFGCVWIMGTQGSRINFAATATFMIDYSLLAVRSSFGTSEPVIMINNDMVGMHCGWCFDVEGIQLKLISAVNSDYPRWGDYVAMVDKEMIEFVISRGTFFNLVDLLTPVEWSSLERRPYRDASFCTRFGFNSTVPSV